MSQICRAASHRAPRAVVLQCSRKTFFRHRSIAQTIHRSLLLEEDTTLEALHRHGVGKAVGAHSLPTFPSCIATRLKTTVPRYQYSEAGASQPPVRSLLTQHCPETDHRILHRVLRKPQARDRGVFSTWGFTQNHISEHGLRYSICSFRKRLSSVHLLSCCTWPQSKLYSHSDFARAKLPPYC